MNALLAVEPGYFQNMEPYEIISYVVAAVLIIGALCAALYSWWVSGHSEVTKKSVTRVLRRMGAIREWKVLENCSFADQKHHVVMDQVVVGPFGVLLVKDLHQRADYFGDIDAPEWTLTAADTNAETISKFREKIANPLIECQTAAVILRKRLVDARLGGIQIYTLAVLTRKGKINLYIPGGSESVLTLDRLGDALKAGQYQKDRGVDVAKVTALVAGQ